jgi:anaerobic selenocysteine-containing dehydrogenase
LLAARRPVAYSTWTGVAQHWAATQADRAIAILMALTGSVDAPGGNVQFTRPAVNVINGVDLISAAQRAKALDAAERPLGPAALGVGVPAAAIYRAILERKPYRVRAFIAFGTNVLLTRADPDRGRAALEALEFYAHADPLPNASSQFADIFLPVNDSWEREGVAVGFSGGESGGSLVQLRPQAVPALGESRSDTWIAFQLAQRLGLGDKFWNGDIEAAHDYYLAPTGLSMAMLREKPGGIRVAVTQHRFRHAEQVDGRDRGFDTPSRLVELYSTRMAAHGYDPLPSYTPRPSDPRFGLILTNAKVPHYCQSQHRDIASLRRHVPEPVLELHPDLAGEHGIAEDDWLEVQTASGRARFRASFDSSLERSVVCGHFGWSGVGPYAELVNYAKLTGSEADDPISGAATHRGIACRIERVA